MTFKLLLIVIAAFCGGYILCGVLSSGKREEECIECARVRAGLRKIEEVERG